MLRCYERRISPAYRKPHTCWQRHAALNAGVTYANQHEQRPVGSGFAGSVSPACSSSSRRSPQPSATSCRRPRPRRPHHPSSTSFAVSTVVRLARPTAPSPTARRSSMTRFRVSPTSTPICSVPCAKLQPMPRTTGSSSSSTVAGVPRSTRNNSSVRRSRSTAQKRKLPDGWPPPTRLLTCRGTRSTSGPPMPRRGCPSTAPSTGCARSTATNPGTTNCAPKPSITVARRCTPTLRTIQGCSRDQHVAERGPLRLSAGAWKESALCASDGRCGTTRGRCAPAPPAPPAPTGRRPGAWHLFPYIQGISAIPRAVERGRRTTDEQLRPAQSSPLIARVTTCVRSNAREATSVAPWSRIEGLRCHARELGRPAGCCNRLPGNTLLGGRARSLSGTPTARRRVPQSYLRRHCEVIRALRPRRRRRRRLESTPCGSMQQRRYCAGPSWIGLYAST